VICCSAGGMTPHQEPFLQPEELAEKEHRKWFAASLESDRRIVLLASIDGKVMVS